MKIDKRKHYIMVIDTETANTPKEDNKLNISSGLVYDLGGLVMDTRGDKYEKFSFLIKEIFLQEKEIMQSSYYKEKIPLYYEMLNSKEIELTNWFYAKMFIRELIDKYQIKEIVAHNAYFDYTVLNATDRWLTKSKYRYFFPKDIELWDSLKMSRSVMGKMKSYDKFCKEHDFLTKNGKNKFTAEVIYSFLKNNPNFEESHTALADCEIESEIIAYCYRQKKKMNKKLFKEKE